MSEMNKDEKDNSKMKEIFENFTKRKFIPCNALIEGLYIGRNGVQGNMRKDAMDAWFRELFYKIENAQIIIMKKSNLWDPDKILPLPCIDKIEYIIKSITYFIEMNQDIYNQQILDGLDKMICDVIDEKINYDPDRDIGYYIPNINVMNPLTQEIIKQMLGELLVMLVVGIAIL